MLNLKLQNYIDWDVKSVFKLPDRNNYAYRVVLKYQDGTQQIQQKSGFQTKKEAENARKRTMVLSCKLDAPAPCRLDAPDFSFVC